MEKMLKPIKIKRTPLFLSFYTKKFIKPNIFTILNQKQKIFDTITKESDVSQKDVSII